MLIVISLRYLRSSALHIRLARLLVLLLFVLLAGELDQAQARPHIKSLSPTTGPAGTSVIISGSNFGFSQGTGTVSFNGTLATPSSWSATSIIASVPAGATTGNVVVTVGGAASNGVAFTVIPTPSISSISPTFGPISTSVTIAGTNFGPAQGTSTVTFNGIAGAPTSWSHTSIAVPVPNGAATGNVVVTVNGIASQGVSFTVTQGPLTVAVSPKRAAVTMSAAQTVQFTATVSNDPTHAGVTWQVDGSNGGNATTGTVSPAGLFTPGTQPGQHTVTAVSNANASVNASAMVAVTDLTGVYTHHNDNARTGQNLKEYGLTPATINSASFGQLFSCNVDGYVYAEPLWVANVNFGGTIHNVVFIATEHDSVYAFDADSPSCVKLWQASFVNGSTVTPFLPSDINGNGDIVPEIGITSTPVIDPSTNTIYVVPKTRETAGTVNGQACSSASPCYVHRLHALDLTTGAEKFGGPVVITAPNFTPLRHLQRPGLLLANNTVYLTFGSHGDQCNYAGWIMGYNPTTLAQIFANPLTDPTLGNCNKGGIWQSGAGPAADAGGNVYFSTGNGVYDGTLNFGDTAVKLSPAGSVLDWFTPFNQSVFAANDIDLASAGITILPDAVGSAAHPHLAIATGKVSILYLLDQTNLGKFTCNTCSNNDVQEVVPVPPPNTTMMDGGNYGNIAFWATGANTGNIYTTGQNFPLSQFSISNAVIATPQSAKSSNMFPPRGGIPAVSANGTNGGVVWIVDYTGWQNGTASILDAYDATNVGTLLYSSPGSGTGSAGLAVKFTVPTVANAKVYVGGQYSFSVFGLLPN